MASDGPPLPSPTPQLASVTFGTPVTVNKNTFQAVVVRVAAREDLPEALGRIKRLPRFRRFQSFPCAVRVRYSPTANSSAPGINNESNPASPEEGQDRILSPKPILRPQPPSDGGDPVFESWEDDAQPGVGDRLLHLLQRWQVENVLLVVARRDSSLCQRLLGAELFRLALEAAKLSLEQYYLDSIKPSEAAKLELLENPAPVSSQPQVAPQAPAVCVMDSDTVPSWPKQHQPTSDGGGRKGAKQGRINHFMHRYSSPRSVHKADPLSPSSPSNNDAAAPVTVDSELAVDGSGTTGGIDWLDISRDEWLQLRSIRVPVKELHYLFMCLVVLLDAPPEQRAARKAAPTPKMQEEFTPSDFSWLRCREILHHSASWSPRLRELRGAMLAKSQASALRAIFQEPAFTSDSFVRISIASAKIFAWLQRLLDEYDEKGLGLLPNQQPDELPVVVDAGVAKTEPSTKSPRAKKQQPDGGNGSSKPHDDGVAQSSEFEGLLTLTRAFKPKIVDRGRLFGSNHNLSGSR